MNEYVILVLFGLWALIPIVELIKDMGETNRRIYDIERLLSLPSHLVFWQKKRKKRRG